MQGRLSPIVNGKIQTFPWNHWQQEFKIAYDNGFSIIEWTLDQDRIYDNPVMTTEGQQEIRDLSSQYEISISSLTGDCFMQAPFYKVIGKDRESLLQDLQNIITSCGLLGVEYIVFPLVDNGRLENSEQEKALLKGLSLVESDLHKNSIKIIANTLKHFYMVLFSFLSFFSSHLSVVSITRFGCNRCIIFYS